MNSLYRFISFETFVDIVQRKELAFVRPETWDDPCESYLLKALRSDQGKKEIRDLLDSLDSRVHKGKNHDALLKLLGNQFYGQCWTKKDESDALWRIYSNNKKAIRIEISIEDLKYLKYEEIEVVHKHVDYTKTMTLESEVNRVFKKETMNPADIFFAKREAFDHEDEYRVMVYNPIERSGDVIYISFQAIDHFIKSAMLHPQAPKWFHNTVEEYCKKNEVKYIGQSKLYSNVFE